MFQQSPGLRPDTFRGHQRSRGARGNAGAGRQRERPEVLESVSRCRPECVPCLHLSLCNCLPNHQDRPFTITRETEASSRTPWRPAKAPSTMAVRRELAHLRCRPFPPTLPPFFPSLSSRGLPSLPHRFPAVFRDPSSLPG